MNSDGKKEVIKYLSILLVLATFGISIVGTHQTTNSSAKSSCITPTTIQVIHFSASKYPNIKNHWESAAASPKWPTVMKINRIGAAERRVILLSHQPHQTKNDGLDQDEFPPAMSRNNWPADIRLIPAHENRSQGSSMGAKLRKFCNGTKWRAVFD
jgi:hypothetical protein